MDLRNSKRSWCELPVELLNFVGKVLIQQEGPACVGPARETCKAWREGVSGAVETLYLEAVGPHQWSTELEYVAKGFGKHLRALSLLFWRWRKLPPVPQATTRSRSGALVELKEETESDQMLLAFNALKAFTKLSYLRLDCSYAPFGQAALQSLANLSHLQELTLSSAEFGPTDPLHLLSHLRTLTCLRFGSSSGICDKLMEQLACLQPLKQLEFTAGSSYTSEDALSDEGMQHLARLLNLETLVMQRLKWCSKITIGGFAALTSLRHLRVLELDVGMLGVVGMLSRLAALQVLRVEADYSVDSNPFLEECAAVGPCLHSLSIRVIEQSRNRVFAALAALTSLRHLDISLGIPPDHDPIACDLRTLSSLSQLTFLEVKKPWRRSRDLQLPISDGIIAMMAKNWTSLTGLSLYLDKADYVPDLSLHLSLLVNLQLLGLHVGYYIHPTGLMYSLDVGCFPPRLQKLSVSNTVFTTSMLLANPDTVHAELQDQPDSTAGVGTGAAVLKLPPLTELMVSNSDMPTWFLRQLAYQLAPSLKALVLMYAPISLDWSILSHLTGLTKLSLVSLDDPMIPASAANLHAGGLQQQHEQHQQPQQYQQPQQQQQQQGIMAATATTASTEGAAASSSPSSPSSFSRLPISSDPLKFLCKLTELRNLEWSVGHSVLELADIQDLEVALLQLPRLRLFSDMRLRHAAHGILEHLRACLPHVRIAQ